MKHYLLLALLCFAFRDSFGQIRTEYFRDTSVRMGSVVYGSIQIKEEIYSWRSGTGVIENIPIIIKSDAAGKVIWNSAEVNPDQLVFPGYFLTYMDDQEYIYLLGQNNTHPQERVFFTKISKYNGSIELYKDSIPIILKALKHWKDLGGNIRLVSSEGWTTLYGRNELPITSINISKATGATTVPVPYGLPNMLPQFFDGDDVYYLDGTTLIKYHVPSKTTLWSQQNFQADIYAPVFPPVDIRKDGNLLFVTGNRSMHTYDARDGRLMWTHWMANYSNMDFYLYHSQVVKDTLYTSWSHNRTGSITQFGIFAKMNKLTGQLYFSGTITDNGGISYTSEGYMTKPLFAVDSAGTIFLTALHTNTEKRIFKTLSGKAGELVAQYEITADSSRSDNYGVIPVMNDSKYFNIHIQNNYPVLVFTNGVISRGGVTSGRINHYRFNPGNGSLQAKQHFDNNLVQYASETFDILGHHQFTYVLKRLGQNVYCEKYSSDMKMLWQREITRYCPSAPVRFAIDSTGVLCILSHGNLSCTAAPRPMEYNDLIHGNRTTFLDSDGNLIYDAYPEWFAGGSPLQLIGTELGFYAFSNSVVYTFNYGYGKKAFPPVDFVTAGHHKNFRTNSNIINGKDSLYIFCSGALFNCDAFYMVMDKATEGRRQTSLQNVHGQGLIMHARKSDLDSEQVYLAGTAGSPYNAALTKLNLVTRQVLWQYPFTNRLAGEFVRVEEDNKGFVYGFLKGDSIHIIKLRASDGHLIWKYSRAGNSSTRCVDMALNNNSGLLVAAISWLDPSNPLVYNSAALEISMQTGKLNGTQLFPAAEGNSFINVVKSIEGNNIVYGGRVMDKSKGGAAGFLTINSNTDPAVQQPCNLSPGFTYQADATNSSRYQFTNNTVADSAVQYVWYFGNGDSSIAKHPAYTFTRSGQYNISLKAIRNANCQSLLTQLINVTVPVIPPPCNLLVQSSYKIDTLFPREVMFASIVNRTDIRYLWNFGDGHIDTTSNPKHVYNSVGTYQVCLKVSASASCSREICQTVQITNLVDKLTVVPNPVSNRASLVLNASENGMFTIRIFDSHGNVVLQSSFNAVAGSNSIALDVSMLKSGLYIIRAENIAQNEMTRFPKL